MPSTRSTEAVPGLEKWLQSFQKRWTLVEQFEGETEVGQLKTSLCGLVATDGQDNVVGSAGSKSAERARLKAEFELLERIGLLEAKRSDAERWVLFDHEGRQQGILSHLQIFAEAQDGFRPAISNGCAIHDSWEQAIDSARRELLERDAVLRAWYGAQPIKSCRSVEDPWGLGYEVFEMSFAAYHRCEVSGILGFPSQPGQPLAMGFGAAPSQAEACEKAWSECRQRMGFLWGEEIPEEAPISQLSPHYHQEHYLWLGSHAVLKRWCLQRDWPKPAGSLRPIEWDEVRFIDLSPQGFAEELFLVKAYHPQAHPLYFGSAAPSAYWPEGSPPVLVPHPLC